jgi:hypothetical protein
LLGRWMGQVVGRCSVTRRAERASRPGTLMSWARMVPVVARASKAEARVPAARVRLKAIAAQTSQALLAQNLRRLLDGVTAGTTASPRGAIREVGRSLTGWWSRRSGSGFGPQPRTRAASRGRPGPSNRTRVAPNPRPTVVMAGVRPALPSLALACTSSGSPRRRGVRGSPPRCA